MVATVKALWKRSSLIRTLTVSNLKQSHRNTVLGYLWWLIDPFLMTAVYTIVIGIVLKRGKMIPAYPAFAMCGLMAWKAFANTIGQSLNVVSRSEGIIKSFRFPRAALPISVVLSNQILFLFALIPLVAVCLFYKFRMEVGTLQMGRMFALVPAIVVVHFSICCGGALMCSCFGVFFRDLGNLMAHILRVGWYMSPGLYTIAHVIEGYDGFLSADWSSVRSIYVLNPFAHIMEGYRACIMYNRLPDLAGLAFAFGLGILSILAGLWVFHLMERKFAKVI
ncbi:MAG: ABC transporter permease [Planctomycetota bacterium]|jgi:ABC-type polysaccharide/polyol phosphate export permease